MRGLRARLARTLVLVWVLWDVAHQLLRGRQVWLLQQQGVLHQWPWVVPWGWVLGASLFWAAAGLLWWVGLARNQSWAWRWAWAPVGVFVGLRAWELLTWADRKLIGPRLPFWVGYTLCGLGIWLGLWALTWPSLPSVGQNHRKEAT